jgi:hypothetical protein
MDIYIYMKNLTYTNIKTMGPIINEKIKYITLQICQMAAQHCRIKKYVVQTYIYCLAVIKGHYLR